MKRPDDPPRYEPLPLLKRIRLRLILWTLKTLVPAHVFILKLKQSRLPASKKPTIVKSYSPLPKRDVCVFIPPSYKSGDPPLPLVIDIHGGGFCIGAPILDNPDNLILSHEHGFCVVSIPYRLGPTHKWPTAPNDCAAMITAVIEDESLPVDRNTVVIVGYSAGGNLALSSVQLLRPEIRSRVKGIAAYYPAVDQVPTFGRKAERQTLAPNGKDILHWMGPMFNSGYIPPGTDKSEPTLSPIYTRREDLPAKVSLLGCEYDILCVEAGDMAEDLAEQEAGEKVPLGDGREGWTKGGLRWEVVKDVVHGFNQIPVSGEEAVKMKEKTLKMHAGIADWLKKEVFA